MVTVIAIVVDSVPVLMFHMHAPLLVCIIFSIGFGLFGLLLTCFAFSAWFKSCRVAVSSSGVEVTNHYLFFHRSRHFNASEIERFDIAAGSTSGTQTYWNIKLIQRGQSSFQENKARYQQSRQLPPMQLRALASPDGATIATGMANRAEADWLVKQMTSALGRSSVTSHS